VTTNLGCDSFFIFIFISYSDKNRNEVSVVLETQMSQSNMCILFLFCEGAGSPLNPLLYINTVTYLLKARTVKPAENRC
jgi:hypothetical protein